MASQTGNKPTAANLWILLVVAGALAAGCASVKTTVSQPGIEEVTLRPPARIFIEPFSVESGQWEGDAADEANREQISDWLASQLELRLAEIAPTDLLEEAPPRSGWLVTGRFLRVNPGSRVQRMVFGQLGAGATKLETRVEVYDLAVSTTEPIINFNTTGGSNLTGGISGASVGLDNDVDRTAREIRDFLAARVWQRSADTGVATAPAALEPVEIAPAAAEDSR